ncbi:MAG: hypothetical protein JKY67_05740 [Pseudomonadales bacterium]|nr:hypothetical protein [Pseudomonadales bacterium]
MVSRLLSATFIILMFMVMVMPSSFAEPLQLEVLTVSANESFDAPVNDPQLKNSERAVMWRILLGSQKRIQHVMLQQAGMDEVNQLMTRSCDIPFDTFLEGNIRALEAKRASLKRRTALSLRGGYTNRDVIDDGESSAYLELNWDVLRNGFFENRRESETLEAEVALETHKIQEKLRSKAQRCRRHQISVGFVGIKKALLTLKRELMVSVNRIERRAYLKGWSYLEDAFVAESEIALIDMELTYLKGYASPSAALASVMNVPALDVDFEGLTKLLAMNHEQNDVFELEQALIRKKGNQRYQDRLQLYVRKNIDVDGAPGSDNAILGVRESRS